jgi:hypothetical protein
MFRLRNWETVGKFHLRSQIGPIGLQKSQIDPPPAWGTRCFTEFLSHSLACRLHSSSLDKPLTFQTILNIRGSSVSIVTRLQPGRLGVRFLVGVGIISLLHHVQTGSGAHPTSYPMCTGGYFPRSKALGA